MGEARVESSSWKARVPAGRTASKSTSCAGSREVALLGHLRRGKRVAHVKVEAGKQGKVLFAVLAVLGVVGMIVVIYGTRWGPWGYSDAVGYMVNARNLATGRGLGLYRPSGQFVPLVSHPPLYPLLLIAFSGPSLNLVAAARWIDVLCFGILVWASGWLFYRLTNSAWASLAMSGLLLAQPALINAYTSAMAEPIFLLTEVVGSLLLLLYIEGGKRLHLVLAGVVTGMAFLTRYPGAVFVACGALFLVLFGSRPLRQRLKDFGLYCCIAVIPVAAFVAWSNIRYSGATPRGLKQSYSLLPEFVAFLRKIPSIVYSWKPVTAEMASSIGANADLLRGLGKPAVAAALLVGVIFVIGSARKMRSQIGAGNLKASVFRIPGLFLLIQAGYMAFFGVAYVVTSPTPDVDGRTILPILPALIVTLLSVGYILVQSWPRALWIRLIAGICIVGSVAGYISISIEPLQRLHENGAGYTSPQWRKSETIQAAKSLPTDIPLISNEPIAVLFYVDHWPHELSVTGEPGLPSSYTRYGDGTDEMESIFRDQHAALILFDTIYTQIGAEYQGETQARIEALTKGLTVEFMGGDGAIYTYP